MVGKCFTTKPATEKSGKINNGRKKRKQDLEDT